MKNLSSLITKEGTSHEKIFVFRYYIWVCMVDINTSGINKTLKITHDISSNFHPNIRARNAITKINESARNLFDRRDTIKVDGPFPAGCLHSSITDSLSNWNSRDKAGVSHFCNSRIVALKKSEEMHSNLLYYL